MGLRKGKTPRRRHLRRRSGSPNKLHWGVAFPMGQEEEEAQMHRSYRRRGFCMMAVAAGARQEQQRVTGLWQVGDNRRPQGCWQTMLLRTFIGIGLTQRLCRRAMVLAGGARCLRRPHRRWRLSGGRLGTGAQVYTAPRPRVPNRMRSPLSSLLGSPSAMATGAPPLRCSPWRTATMTRTWTSRSRCGCPLPLPLRLVRQLLRRLDGDDMVVVPPPRRRLLHRPAG